MSFPPPDMSNYVTRTELGSFEERLDRKFALFIDAVLHKLDQFEARFDEKLDKLEARFDEKLDKLEARFDEKLDKLEVKLEHTEKRLSVELARHANAIQENVAAQIRVVDEKYADLPGRVTALEQAQPQKRVRKPARTRSR